MKLNTFAGAAKEIMLTSLAALVLFAVLATQDAKAAEPISQESAKLAETIALVTQLEQSVSAAKATLEETQVNYEAGKASIEEIFFVTLKFHDIEDSLVNAKTALVLELAKYNHSQKHVQIANTRPTLQ